MHQGYDVLDALSAIDPASLDYGEWLEVGQALHHEGYSSDVWRDWSRSDARRFDERDFESKWRGFGNSANPVTGGTIVKMARDAGWRPKGGGYMAMELADTLAASGSPRPIADGTVAAGDVLEPMDPSMTAEQQASAYLEALFEPDEHVGYVCQAEHDESRGKWKPGGRGTYARTCAEIVKALAKGSLESALGSYEREAGIWCCFNPLDGEGRNNTNVTSLRYVLVESDETEPAVCKSVVEQLNLPVAAMVFSGAKSLHAIVRVDAADLKEYAERREAVYAACEAGGMAVDRSNKNPARLSRLPGARRGDKEQFLVSLARGAADFDEWQEWYEAANDDLPDCESLADIMKGELPKLADELIAGVLRRGHKMLVSGPSKAGKSFLLIALCICLAEGLRWLGFQCRQSKVLYVNLELDAASCWHRFADVYAAMGLKGDSAENIDVWNLRGLAQPMGKLLPKMVRRGREAGYEVVVIDPIYKIMTGDENSAADMAAFSNAFDRLAREVECSVIYCHHHSKGYQDGKRAIDRASGSGVFGRDPDAVLDLIELDVDGGKVSKRESMSRNPEAATPTAWRCEGTLREFAAFRPVNMWFEYPLHVVDENLFSEKPKTGLPATTGSGSHSKKKHKQKVNEAFADVFDQCETDGVKFTKKEAESRMKVNGKSVTKRTIENYLAQDWCEWRLEVDAYDGKTAGVIVRKTDSDTGEEW